MVIDLEIHLEQVVIVADVHLATDLVVQDGKPPYGVTSELVVSTTKR